MEARVPKVVCAGGGGNSPKPGMQGQQVSAAPVRFAGPLLLAELILMKHISVHIAYRRRLTLALDTGTLEDVGVLVTFAWFPWGS